MENNETTQDIIKKRVAELPSYIREGLSKIAWDKEIIEIGKKHGLHVDEMGTLQTETVMVLVGLVHPDDYAKNLREELHLPRITVDLIVEDVNQKIFKNIRQSLIDFLSNEQAEEDKPKVPENIFQKTGIELSPEKAPITKQPDPTSQAVDQGDRSVLEHSGIMVDEDIPDMDADLAIDRKDLLSNLENPPKSPSSQFSHVIRSKLSDAVISPPEKTKYEDIKPLPATPQPPKRELVDPYREQIS